MSDKWNWTTSLRTGDVRMNRDDVVSIDAAGRGWKAETRDHRS
jgi:hypothetical protein